MMRVKNKMKHKSLENSDNSRPKPLLSSLLALDEGIFYRRMRETVIEAPLIFFETVLRVLGV